MRKTIAVWFSDPPGLGLDDQADAAAAAIENLSDCMRGQLGIEAPALEMALFDVWAAKCPREVRIQRLTNLQSRCEPAKHSGT